MLDKIIPKAYKNGQDKKWEKPHFSKALLMAFDKFWFLNLVGISIERFDVIIFAIAVAQTLYF